MTIGEIKSGLSALAKQFNPSSEESKLILGAVEALAQEPKTGLWIDADGDNAICGCCNRLNHLYGTYCKHCGARMVEPQESEG